MSCIFLWILVTTEWKLDSHYFMFCMSSSHICVIFVFENNVQSLYKRKFFIAVERKTKIDMKVKIGDNLKTRKEEMGRLFFQVCPMLYSYIGTARRIMFNTRLIFLVSDSRCTDGGTK
jgi:hypothetical protein